MPISHLDSQFPTDKRNKRRASLWNALQIINLQLYWGSGLSLVCYLLSCVQLFVTPWTVSCQPPLSIKFSRQEYWSGLSFFSSGGSSQPRAQTLFSCIAVRFFTIWATSEAQPLPWRWQIYLPKNQPTQQNCICLSLFLMSQSKHILEGEEKENK